MNKVYNIGDRVLYKGFFGNLKGAIVIHRRLVIKNAKYSNGGTEPRRCFEYAIEFKSGRIKTTTADRLF